MKISKVETKLFEYTSYVESDDEGHGHPAKSPRKVSQCMVIIETDEPKVTEKSSKSNKNVEIQSSERTEVQQTIENEVWNSGPIWINFCIRLHIEFVMIDYFD